MACRTWFSLELPSLHRTVALSGAGVAEVRAEALRSDAIDLWRVIARRSGNGK